MGIKNSSYMFKKYKDKLDRIDRFDFKDKSEEELKKRSMELKAAVQADMEKGVREEDALDDVLNEAFALVKEAVYRVNGFYPHREQYFAGMMLHKGNIVEQKTGEGKTITAAFPSYLNALAGKGVHVVTVNDYLAERDANNIGRIHRMLGLTTGCVLADMKPADRKKAYDCDITYVTNNELGFDYLKDNLVKTPEDLVQRGFHFAVIDEADSVLIDEARTPLIISGKGNVWLNELLKCSEFAKKCRKGKQELDRIGNVLKETGDIIVSEEEKTITLTEAGTKRAEKFFGVENLSAAENIRLMHNIMAALRATFLMNKNVDYIVRNSEIFIVDEFTGRVLQGRKFNEGLHQAIEAKEHVTIGTSTNVIASVTFQNFFNKYEKKCGMTGTAMTEENEFRDIYKMQCVEVPTHLPVIREDLDDCVFATKSAKYAALINEIAEAYERRQPVLVGTTSVDTSELISKFLKKRNIPHKVLNAKNHKREAGIIAEAGRAGSVTIATNMAGRGTDIKLDDEAREKGGLKVIGTERHESRRIDNQLRGRSGRQGDVGESVFFISLEDDLMHFFGAERVISMYKKLDDPNKAIRHKDLNKAVKKAQEKVENENFQLRKHVFNYDMVLNEQRELIYSTRREVLLNGNIQESFMSMMERGLDGHLKKDSLELFNEYVKNILRLDEVTEQQFTDKKALKETIIAQVKDRFEEKKKEFEADELYTWWIRHIFLRAIDRNWMDHIDKMDMMLSSINMQAVANKNPETEYKRKAHEEFLEMLTKISDNVIKNGLNVKIDKSALQKERSEEKQESDENQE